MFLSLLKYTSIKKQVTETICPRLIIGGNHTTGIYLPPIYNIKSLMYNKLGVMDWTYFGHLMKMLEI